MKKLLISICVLVVALSVFCVPAFAVQYEQYSYGGHILPQIPAEGNGAIFTSGSDYYVFYTNNTTFEYSENSQRNGGYQLIDGEWIKQDGVHMATLTPVWSAVNVYNKSANNYVLNGSEVVITIIDTTIDFLDFSAPFTSLMEQFSVMSAVDVCILIVGACVGLAFMWWGVRKLTRALMTAFKKGKVRL